MTGLLRSITADEIKAFDRDGAVLLKNVIICRNEVLVDYVKNNGIVA